MLKKSPYFDNKKLFMLRKYHYAFILVLVCFVQGFTQITDYQVYFANYNNQIVVRKWTQNNSTQYLVLNPSTLKTNILSNIATKALSWEAISGIFRGSRYIHDWKLEQQKDISLQDAGISKSDSTVNGFSLTVDLCPSSKPLARSFFEAVIKGFEVSERPVPITITVTGIWMKNHLDDLAWLKQQELLGNLRITWVNHSYNHHYDPKLPLKDNFLLEKGTVIADEVLLNEQAMLENGLVPSIYFRFPGLVSSKVIFDQILSYGLLPLGSDAWLAKGQAIHQGSLVLVHANGNEPLGLELFLSMLQKNQDEIKHKKWQLWDISNLISSK
ncbi:hypothetical protein [Flectobacillus major]|uniref:hypothetical protein n=1 Tax=Flectobacillus major TaxID=103 RepID=UPI000409D5A1|nr:hypothetical protein [Flectobacillus major]